MNLKCHWGSLLTDVIYLSLFCTVAALFAVQMQNVFSLTTIRDLYFGFGGMIENLIEYGTYGGSGGSLNNENTEVFYSHRFPFIPFFYYGISFFSESYIVAAIIKNVFFWFGTYLISKYCVGMPTKWFLVFFLMASILTNSGILALDYEEGYSPFLVLWLVIAIQKRIFPLFATALIMLLCLKSSYWLPITIIVLGICLSSVFTAPQKIKTVLLLLLFSVSWSTWTYQKSGYIATPLNASTFDGLNLLKGVNPISNTVYPEFSADTVDQLVLEKYANPQIKIEYAVNQHFKSVAMEIIRHDPVYQLKRVIDNLLFIGSNVYWARENVRLRHASAENLEVTFIEEEQNLPQNDYLLIYRVIILMIEYLALLFSFLYLCRKSQQQLLIIPFLFCWANLLIFCHPRHLYLITIPLCYWCICYFCCKEKQCVEKVDSNGISKDLLACR